MESKLDKELISYLCDPENDLLTEFKAKAPGTFKHCEEVSNLCEKIGRELKLDIEFLKIIGLYHDIGKMLNPKYFSENQPKDFNVHDDLNPEISAHFIISHVANSIAVLATRVKNIDIDIIKCISMHHSDSVLKVFLSKLPEDERENAKDAFRYPYSKPDNVYACILMIADIVEAKIRSLRNTQADIDIPKEIKGIIEHLTIETNLDELTIRQGRIISDVLVSEYSAVEHKRVTYEDQAAQNAKK